MRFSPRAVAAATSMLVWVGNPGVSFADESLAATLGLSTGYSDNILSGPENPTNLNTAPPVQEDGFGVFSPGFVFTHETRQLTHAVRYAWNARIYQEHNEANSYDSTLQYLANYALSPVSQLGLGVSALNGRSNSFAFEPVGQPMQVRPPTSDIAFLTAAVTGFYLRELNPFWRFRETVGISAFIPVDETSSVGKNYTLSDAVSFERGFKSHAITMSVQANYTSLERSGGDGMALGNEQVLSVGPELRWIWDLTPTISTDITGGLSVTVQADDFSNGATTPLAGAAIRYVTELAAASLGYRTSVDANLFAADLQVIHLFEAAVSMRIPFTERWRVSAGSTYSRGKSLDLAEGRTRGHNELFGVNASLSLKLNYELAMVLSYQSRRQIQDLPPISVNELTSRREIVFGLEGQYPSREAAEVPKRNSVRADRSDETQDPKAPPE